MEAFGKHLLSVGNSEDWNVPNLDEPGLFDTGMPAGYLHARGARCNAAKNKSTIVLGKA
jgi:hypothetical protein